MAKGNSKKKYKQFPILNAEDGLSALGMLINGVAVNLRKYNEYSLEADELRNKYITASANENSEILIPEKEYNDINHKLLFCQREILKYASDHQDSSLSYISLRKLLVKNKLLASKLGEKMEKVLNDLLDLRNWSFHNPQSLMVANTEVAKKHIVKDIKKYVEIQPQLNPFIISYVDYYDLQILESLCFHTQVRKKQFEAVLKSMKSDYEEIYANNFPERILLFGPIATKRVIFLEQPSTRRFGDHPGDVAQISMAIQKSKYDGSNKSFNQWAITPAELDDEDTEQQASEAAKSESADLDK